MALMRDLASAAIGGSLLAIGPIVQSGNPLLVAGAGTIGAISGFATNRSLPSTRHQIATRNKLKNPKWLSSQIKTLRELVADSQITVEPSPHIPDDLGCEPSRSDIFWQDLPIQRIEPHRLLRSIAEDEPLNSDILWKLLRQRQFAEKLYEEQNRTLAKVRSVHKEGIELTKSIEEVEEEINGEVTKIDVAYRQAWLYFTNERQRRRDEKEEQKRQEAIQRQLEEFTNGWMDIKEQLVETEEADMKNAGFRALKEALFQGVLNTNKNDDNLKLAKDAIEFIGRAEVNLNEYMTPYSIYVAIHDRFGEDLNLMTPEEFVRRYPGVDSNII